MEFSSEYHAYGIPTSKPNFRELPKKLFDKVYSRAVSKISSTHGAKEPEIVSFHHKKGS